MKILAFCLVILTGLALADGPPPGPNPTGRLIEPRHDQSTDQQAADQQACFDSVCEDTGWNPYEAYAEMTEAGYTVALAPDELEAGLICLAAEGATIGAVAGDILNEDPDEGEEIGTAISVAAALVRSDYLIDPDDPETQRVVERFERALRKWDRKFAVCLKQKGYRVPSP